MQAILGILQKAKSIVLSTHRQCDGDGLGAQLALFHALKKVGKDVQIINVDETPRKYHFLSPDTHIQYFTQNKKLPDKVDAFLVFDTNDERLVEPLLTAMKKHTDNIIFVDHHPLLLQGPRPGTDSWIDTRAASTGEMAYDIIKGLGIAMDRNIARALYTSITFDTQLYRFIRNSPRSHEIAAELLGHNIDPEGVHRALFGNQTVNKMAFLAKALGQIEYFAEGRLAVLRIRDADLFHYNLDPDDSRDVVDMVMNIETLETAALFREDMSSSAASGTGEKFKLSLRSKGQIEVLDVAEHFGGGGHLFSAGATMNGKFDQLKAEVVKLLSNKLQAHEPE